MPSQANIEHFILHFEHEAVEAASLGLRRTAQLVLDAANLASVDDEDPKIWLRRVMSVTLTSDSQKVLDADEPVKVVRGEYSVIGLVASLEIEAG